MNVPHRLLSRRPRGLRAPSVTASMIRSWATVWIFFVLLIAPAFAAATCKRALFSEWVTPPPGFQIEAGLGDGYIYLQSTSLTPSERYVLVQLTLQLDDTTLVYPLSDGPTFTWHEMIPAVEWCREGGSDLAGPAVSVWSFLGWPDGTGGYRHSPLEGPPRPDGPQQFGEWVYISHGIQAMGSGTCNCSGGGDPSDGSNTNKFHLDVTNSLAGIQSTLGQGFSSLTNGVGTTEEDSRASAALGRFASFSAAVTNLMESNPAWQAFKEDGNLAGTLPDVTPITAGWWTVRVGDQVLDIGLIFDDSIASSTDLIGILRTIVAFTVAFALFLTITWENKNVVLSAMQISKGTVIGRNTAAAVPGLGVAVASVVVLSVITLVIMIPTLMAFAGSEVWPKLGVPEPSALAMSSDPAMTLTEMFTQGHVMWAQLWIRFLQFCPATVIVTAGVNYMLYARVQNTVQILFYAVMKHIPV